MPATSKAALIEVTHKEYAKLTALIGGIDEDTAIQKREEDTSIKDIIAHRAHWVELFLGWYNDGQAGKPVFFPAEGYKWNDLKRYNAELRRAQADVGWPGAVALLEQNAQTLVNFINARSDAELYGGPMKGAKNAWTTGRWAEAAGPSHFRSASKYIRSVLRSAC